MLAIKLSAGATSFSPAVELAGDAGAGATRGGRVGGICAADPPSAVLTVISGDMATMISSVDDGFSTSSGKTAGLSEGWSKPVKDVSCEVGVQLI